ncbi:MAG: hypothetical protein DRO99_00430 [Candidatus Aenigmatarchaeota archaeon]|nr:MAG: hypothetical protein DRO99_00430 [Candidatus Aenigmarchaeota archaeon]
MSKIIFITGLEETGRDTIVEMTIGGSKNSLMDFKHVSFEKLGISGLKDELSDTVRKARDGFYKNVEREVSDALRSGLSVIVEGPITMKTENGYLPLVPKEFFEAFSPDVIMLFETPHERGNSRIDWKQQHINRAYAAMYASLGGSLLKIIEVSKGEVKDALRECKEVMSSVMGKGV